MSGKAWRPARLRGLGMATLLFYGLHNGTLEGAPMTRGRQTYSASGLVKHALSLHVYDVDTLAGLKYWKVPDGCTLSYLASTLNEEPGS